MASRPGGLSLSPPLFLSLSLLSLFVFLSLPSLSLPLSPPPTLSLPTPSHTERSLRLGMHNEQAAGADVQAIIDAVKADVEGKLGRALAVYEAKTAATQVVAGTNFFVRVHVGEGQYIHVRVWRKLDGHAVFSSVLDGKTEADPLVYF
jgi:cystatin-A/B